MDRLQQLDEELRKVESSGEGVAGVEGALEELANLLRDPDLREVSSELDDLGSNAVAIGEAALREQGTLGVAVQALRCVGNYVIDSGIRVQEMVDVDAPSRLLEGALRCSAAADAGDAVVEAALAAKRTAAIVIYNFCAVDGGRLTSLVASESMLAALTDRMRDDDQDVREAVMRTIASIADSSEEARIQLVKNSAHQELLRMILEEPHAPVLVHVAVALSDICECIAERSTRNAWDVFHGDDEEGDDEAGAGASKQGEGDGKEAAGDGEGSNADMIGTIAAALAGALLDSRFADADAAREVVNALTALHQSQETRAVFFNASLISSLVDVATSESESVSNQVRGSTAELLSRIALHDRGMEAAAESGGISRVAPYLAQLCLKLFGSAEDDEEDDSNNPVTASPPPADELEVVDQLLAFLANSIREDSICHAALQLIDARALITLMKRAPDRTKQITLGLVRSLSLPAAHKQVMALNGCMFAVLAFASSTEPSLSLAACSAVRIMVHGDLESCGICVQQMPKHGLIPLPLGQLSDYVPLLNPLDSTPATGALQSSRARTGESKPGDAYFDHARETGSKDAEEGGGDGKDGDGDGDGPGSQGSNGGSSPPAHPTPLHFEQARWMAELLRCGSEEDCRDLILCESPAAMRWLVSCLVFLMNSQHDITRREGLEGLAKLYTLTAKWQAEQVPVSGFQDTAEKDTALPDFVLRCAKAWRVTSSSVNKICGSGDDRADAARPVTPVGSPRQAEDGAAVDATPEYVTAFMEVLSSSEG